ncbi:hypothetical protein GCM10011519_19130 [Marmoricola endophyticus]|uniref:Methyltransferase type 11 domain-containing protein n=1 Tax=Marmoricola endophyticus TaxID=2040280 RepID=A0A917BIJ0_9ACTN|nr:class I SAM-dependent methyltransferase [Marmoricola endophyticus]GGF45404.1 hypothetical protein GCM10011519_19130 [Marmoricola endophyticus]
MAGLAPWDDRTVLDLGCGSGFHLPRWADSAYGRAQSVIGVEPHGGLVAMARRRTAGEPRIDVRQGSATDLPLPDASVDVIHARWAYFFGPGCEPGLREVDRVLRRGGTAFVIDNDGSRSTFGGWFRRGYPDIDHDRVVRFWRARGWERHPLTIRWSFTRREDFEAVVRIEFDRRTADAVLAEHLTPPGDGVEVDYAVDLWSLTR